MSRSTPNRVLVIGLDCVPPSVAFRHENILMPAFSTWLKKARYGVLRSSMPPVTLPAWRCMVSGYDPGQLGLYGFRKTLPHDYELHLNDATDAQKPPVWRKLRTQGVRSAALFVPPSFPPMGDADWEISCFLTPDEDQEYTHPPHLKHELSAHFGSYLFDVVNHRQVHDMNAFVDRLSSMATQHFQMARYIWEKKTPDLLMLVEIGTDRLHHALWHRIDPQHAAYEHDHPQNDLARKYYAHLDRQIQKLLQSIDPETTVMFVSDHGAKPLQGGFLINQWLVNQNLLRLKAGAPTSGSLLPEHIDWVNTQVWAEGGYFARIFLNCRDQRPQGSIPKEQVPGLKRRLASKLETISGPQQENWNNLVVDPHTTYKQTRGFAPDLLWIPDDLRWRPLASLHDGALYVARNDTGWDYCNHDWNGIYAIASPLLHSSGPGPEHAITDIAATIEHCFSANSSNPLFANSLLQV